MYFRKDRQIHLVAGITDMRKQINGLAQIANEKKADRVFSGDYFVFLGKTRRVMKVLYWDHTGFCLWVKRLEEESFPWTRKHKGVLTLERERFKLLLKGIDIFREHKVKQYFSV
jgi:transposase